MIIKAGAGKECLGSLGDGDNNPMELRNFLRAYARTQEWRGLENF